MILDASLLNTQHYKVWIKGKVEQSMERRCPPLHLHVVAIEMGAFGLHLTTVANFTLLIYIYIYIYTCGCMYVYVSVGLCIYEICLCMRLCVYMYHHHHHIVLAARISLTLSRHSSLSFIALGRSSGQQPVSSHSC